MGGGKLSRPWAVQVVEKESSGGGEGGVNDCDRGWSRWEQRRHLGGETGGGGVNPRNRGRSRWWQLVKQSVKTITQASMRKHEHFGGRVPVGVRYCRPVPRCKWYEIISTKNKNRKTKKERINAYRMISKRAFDKGLSAFVALTIFFFLHVKTLQYFIVLFCIFRLVYSK